MPFALSQMHWHPPQNQLTPSKTRYSVPQSLQANTNYKESAFTVHSDSKSSCSIKTCQKYSHSKPHDRSHCHSNSRDRPKSIKTDCPDCTVFKHRRCHPNVPNEKCFWNKQYKGYHPKWICDEMEIKYKGRHKFLTAMGGDPLDSRLPIGFRGWLDEWIETKGKRTNKVINNARPQHYLSINKNYLPLATSSTTPDPPNAKEKTIAPQTTTTSRNASKHHIQHIMRQLDQQESAFLERSIIRADNERTELDKKDPHLITNTNWQWHTDRNNNNHSPGSRKAKTCHTTSAIVSFS